MYGFYTDSSEIHVNSDNVSSGREGGVDWEGTCVVAALGCVSDPRSTLCVPGGGDRGEGSLNMHGTWRQSRVSSGKRVHTLPDPKNN